MGVIYELNYLISMKKILFRKLALDCTIFFLISLISSAKEFDIKKINIIKNLMLNRYN